MKVGLPFMKNMLIPLAEIVLVSLGLRTTASAADETIQQKMYGSGMTALIISNK